jgi:hypothetical protein
MDPKRELLRHLLATIAYRGSKALRDAPENFGTLKASESSRTPVEIVAHMGDLFDWALALTQGAATWNPSKPLAWDAEVARMFESLRRLDAHLASEDALQCSPERILQGPIADALTHVGQLMMLRRLAGAPVKGENYFKAAIAVGQTGFNR